MHRLFKLGGFCFAADHPDTLVFPPNFLRFETKDVQPAYFYTLRFVKSIPNPVGVCTAVREDLIVYRDGEKESRFWVYGHAWLLRIVSRAGRHARRGDDRRRLPRLPCVRPGIRVAFRA